MVSRTETRKVLAADLVGLAVHPQQLRLGEGRDIGLGGEHLGGVAGDVDAQVGCQRPRPRRDPRGVVVGERNSSVSDRMHDSIAPFTPSGASARSSPIILRMIVAVQAKGSIRMSIGPLVSSPPTSLWWSMMAWISVSLIPSGSSAGLLVSTITTCGAGGLCPR